MNTPAPRDVSVTEASSDQPRVASLPRIPLIILSALQLAGIYLSELLIDTHISSKLGGGDTGICAASASFSCAEAATSVYSSILGLPIAVLGEAFYLCALLWVIACALLLKPRRAEIGLILLGGATTLSALYSVFLGAVSYFDLGKLCPLCIGLYAVNFLSLGAIAWAKGLQPARWFASLFTSLSWKLAIVMSLSLVSAQSIYAVRYQNAFKRYVKKQQRAKAPVFVKLAPSDAPVRGVKGEVMIVEFSDFQCPYCRRFTRYLKETLAESKEYPFAYSFRHFPLSPQCNPYIKRDLHPRACQAALAGICAQSQDKFWELHDLMFENQRSLGGEELLGYAQEVGVDLEVFKRCLKSEEAHARLQRDIQEGHDYGVPATPAFFVNGWRHLGAKPPRVIRRAVKKYGYGVELKLTPVTAPKQPKADRKSVV